MGTAPRDRLLMIYAGGWSAAVNATASFARKHLLSRLFPLRAAVEPSERRRVQTALAGLAIQAIHGDPTINDDLPPASPASRDITIRSFAIAVPYGLESSMILWVIHNIFHNRVTISRKSFCKRTNSGLDFSA